MRDPQLETLVDVFLYLVEVGSGSTRADEAELAHVLDRLALAMRTLVTPDEPARAPEVPARNRDVLAKVAASRFPAYGAYNRAAHLTSEIGRSHLETGSAIDDIAAIADHLHAVGWLWRNASWDDGLWYLEASYRAHWGESMRALQLYLHVHAQQHAEREAPSIRRA